MVRPAHLVFIFVFSINAAATLSKLERRALIYANSFQPYSYFDLEESFTRVTPQIISLIKNSSKFNKSIKLFSENVLTSYKLDLLTEIDNLKKVRSLREEVRPVLHENDFETALDFFYSVLKEQALHEIIQCTLNSQTPQIAPLDVRLMDLAKCMLLHTTTEDQLVPFLNLLDGITRSRHNLESFGTLK